jgi:hypothetical protein
VSVHEDLRTLVTRYGERVLDVADDLRATLDDFLEEGQATPGEINLLVDAVRLGAHEQMLSMLTHGADPRAAVEGAGARLAEDRGGDQRSASWACATLGFAVGRVPEALVLAYRSQQPAPGTPPGPPAATSSPDYGINPPAAEGPVPPLPPAPSSQSPTSAPQQVYGLTGAPAPTQGPGQPVHPGQTVAPGYGQAWQPPGGSGGGGGRKNLLIGLGAAIAAAVVIAIIAVIATSGGDSPEADDDPTSPTKPTDTAVDPTFSVDDLATTYGALGSTIDAGAESCERSEPEEDETEVVTCTYEQLEVVFTTYTDEAALDDTRSDIEEEASAQSFDLDHAKTSDTGTFQMVSDTTLDVTWMYWDSTEALQSAYVSDTIDDLPSRAANAFFDQRGEADATRVFPEPVAPFESPALWEMAEDYVGDQVDGSSVTGCQTSELYDGDVEAISCVDDDYTLFFYLKEDMEALEAERELIATDSVSDTTWNWFKDKDADYPTSGRLIKRRTEGKAVVYWDESGSLITGYIYAPDSKLGPATDYWVNGE